MSFTVMTFIDRMFLDVVLDRRRGGGHAGGDAAVHADQLSAGRGDLRQHVRGPVSKAPAARGRSGRSSGRESGSDWSPIPLLLLTAPLAHLYFRACGPRPGRRRRGNRLLRRADLRLGSDHPGRHAFRVLHRPRGDAGGDGGRQHGRGAERRAGLPVDLRSRGISPRRHCRRRRGHGLRGMVPRDLLRGHHAAAAVSHLSPGIGLALERRPAAAGSGRSARRAACSGSSNAGRSRSSSRWSAGWERSTRPARCWPSTSTAWPGCR